MPAERRRATARSCWASLPRLRCSRDACASELPSLPNRRARAHRQTPRNTKMTEQERGVVMDLLRSGPDMSQMSLDEVRAIVDQGGAVAKLPENVELESITIG